MKSLLLPALSVATIAVFALPALAQPAPPPGDMISNGFTTQVFFSPSGQPFRAKGTEPYPEATWFAQADKDHDGKISREEFDADAMAFFQMLDRNHDNYISSPENTFYETNIAPEITSIDPRITQPVNYHSQSDPDMGADQDQDPTHGRYQKSIQGASQFSVIDEPQPVRAADANFDFRISVDEWMNATAQRFALLDRNDDGFITPDEMPKTPFQNALQAAADDKAKGKGKKKHFGWGG